MSSAYQQYLKTDYWQRKRAQTLDLYRRLCAMCQASKFLEVHHVQYRRDGKSILYREQTEDLIVLCRPCHELWHRAVKMNPQRVAEVTAQMLGGRHLDWKAETSHYTREPSIEIPKLP